MSILYDDESRSRVGPSETGSTDPVASLTAHVRASGSALRRALAPGFSVVLPWPSSLFVARFGPGAQSRPNLVAARLPGTEHRPKMSRKAGNSQRVVFVSA